MITTTTIFASLCSFILANKADLAVNMIASAAYDGLKSVLNFNSLKNRITRFFKKEEAADNYIEKICDTNANNINKPYRDIEDIFEEMTKEKFNNELYNEIKNWIEENQEQIIKVSKMNFKNEKGFNIGIQNARKNIYNIQGDFKPQKD